MLPDSSICLLIWMTTLIQKSVAGRYTKRGNVIRCIATGEIVDIGNLDCDPLEAAAMLVQVSSTLHCSCACILCNQCSKKFQQRFPEPLAAL